MSMSESAKQYMLMHKNIPVFTMGLDSASGAIVSIGTVYEATHVPVGIPVKKGTVDRGALNEWWQGRGIPASRYGIKGVLLGLRVADTRILLEKNMGLSLSDQYWIRPLGDSVSWEQVNFFINSFSGDMGDILFGKHPDSLEISLMSPDNASDGWLKKKWKIINGKRCLIKGGSGAVWQEPYNEVLASRIMERLGILHVSYSLLTEDGYPYSVCEDFITPDTELVTAWRVMQTAKKANHVSLYRHYLDCCVRLGVCGIEKQIGQMLVLDYIIANEDRHLNNFGLIRNADTLEYMGAAPVYDSGTSLWFNRPLGMIGAGAKVVCKPFKSSHDEQIKVVSDFGWLDFSALRGIDEELRELAKGSVFIDGARCEALCKGLLGRIEMLQKEVVGLKKQVPVDDVRFDVAEDVAYSGNEAKQ